MKGFSGNAVGLWLLAVGQKLRAKSQELKAFPLNSSMSQYKNRQT